MTEAIPVALNQNAQPMSELAASHELGEFHPLVTPELALQSYESFGGDVNRAASKTAFSNGETYHLQMQYPDLTESEAARKAGVLTTMRDKAVKRFGADSPTVSSIDYHLQETEFLACAARLNKLAANGQTNNAQTQAEAEQFVEINEQLYGKPDQEIFNSMLATLKQLYTNDDPRVQALWNQVESGFAVTLTDGTQVVVPELTIPESAKPLPELTPAAAEMLTKEWKLAFPALVEARALMADMVAAVDGQSIDYDPTKIIFTGQQFANILKLGAFGIAQQHGGEPFNVITNPTGATMSWESGDQAVKVGLNRPPAKSTWVHAREDTSHEAMHGIKSINGLLTGEPAMSTGVFTRKPDGTYVDYLTFEEGNNIIGETLLSDNNQVLSLENNAIYYAMSGLVYNLGLDDRQVKELTAKLVTIQILVEDPTIDQAKTAAKVSEFVTLRTERLFRGTPNTTDVLVDGHKPIFTKDIAYFAGMLKAKVFWNEVAAEALQLEEQHYKAAVANNVTDLRARREAKAVAQAHVHQIFETQNQGKIDPTDPTQFGFAQDAYAKRAA
jgi:hypothetical protein